MAARRRLQHRLLGGVACAIAEQLHHAPETQDTGLRCVMQLLCSLGVTNCDLST
jgi:hypothetical protein